MKTQKKRRKEHAKELVRTSRSFLDDLIGLRSVANMSQQEVADLMGVSQSAVSQFEHYDSNPTLASIRRYALAVGADLVLEARPRPTYTAEIAIQNRRMDVHLPTTTIYVSSFSTGHGIEWTRSSRTAESV